MKKLPSLSQNKYENNPFVVQLKGKMYLQPRANSIIAKGQAIYDTSTGEIINESVIIGKKRIVDKSEFAKIYASEIGKLYELSRTAQKVFFYLTKVMDFDNKSYLNYNVDYSKIGYKSGRNIITGLRELIKENIIASTHMVHWYWMNPTIICKGERFAMYTEVVVGKDGEAVKGENMLKQQMKTKIEQLPEQITQKLDKANQGQLYVDYPSENPYQRTIEDEIEERKNQSE